MTKGKDRMNEPWPEYDGFVYSDKLADELTKAMEHIAIGEFLRRLEKENVTWRALSPEERQNLNMEEIGILHDECRFIETKDLEDIE